MQQWHVHDKSTWHAADCPPLAALPLHSWQWRSLQTRQDHMSAKPHRNNPSSNHSPVLLPRSARKSNKMRCYSACDGMHTAQIDTHTKHNHACSHACHTATAAYVACATRHATPSDARLHALVLLKRAFRACIAATSTPHQAQTSLLILNFAIPCLRQTIQLCIHTQAARVLDTSSQRPGPPLHICVDLGSFENTSCTCRLRLGAQ
jgi:hypothetical protein